MCKIDDFICVRVDFPELKLPSCKELSTFLQYDPGLRYNTFFLLFSREKGTSTFGGIERASSMIVIFKKFAYWRFSRWILHFKHEPYEVSFFNFRDFDYGKEASLLYDGEQDLHGVYTHTKCWHLLEFILQDQALRWAILPMTSLALERLRLECF